MSYIAHILVLAGIYAILSVSLNLLVGYAGILSLAQAAFFGIGAYTAAILTANAGTSPVNGVLAAVAMGAICGTVLASIASRVGQTVCVILTFAFHLAFSSLIINWVSLTGGPAGISGIPALDIAGWKVQAGPTFLTAVFSCLVITASICHLIAKSPSGRVLKSIREDETFANAAGKTVVRHKAEAHIIAATGAATAGGLFAFYMRFVDPSSFTLMESIFIVAIVIIGGAGSLWGPVLGAVVLITIPELLRFVGIPTAAAANIRQILYGLALVACMLWRPQGLIGEYAFGREAEPE